MTKPLDHLPLSVRSSELAGVPYLDQYLGAWAVWEPQFQALVDYAETINVQLHLEQHLGPAAGPAAATPAAAMGSGSGSNLFTLTRDGIAMVELRGTMMKHASSFSGGTSTVFARRQIRAAAADDSVAGILLVIDSPGGTVSGTEDLAADLRAARNKKPLFSFIEDIGASAAYWQAAQTSRIAAGPSAAAGSIGVFTVVSDLSKKAEAEGRTVHVIRFGKFKGAGVPGTQVTEEQLAVWQSRIDTYGEQFVATVAAGRRMTVERVRELADGNVHIGEAAKQLGLVDAIETLDATYEALVAEIKKPNSRTRATRMSTENELQGVVTELRESKPAAATIAELRDACEGASDGFLLGQLEKQATVPQALKAHASEMKKQNDALAKERDEAKAQAAAAEKKGALPPRGSQPLGGVTGDAEGSEEFAGGPYAFMQEAIEEKMAKGLSREKAAKAVFRAHPNLQQAVVDEANTR